MLKMPAALRSLSQPGAGGEWRRRLLLHHAPLAVASALILTLFMEVPAFDFGGLRGDIFSSTFPHSGRIGAIASGTDASFIQQSTMATGYLAVVFLGLTLLIGPGNLLLRRRNTVSSYLRRDVRMWTAIGSVVHVILALQVPGFGQLFDFYDYFVAPDGTPWINSFGLGNWTGLAGLVIVLMLLALSTDGSLRELKAKAWKDLQRLNYTLFALVILHAFFYGALLQMTSPFTLVLVFTVIAVVVGQVVGVWLWRRRDSDRRRRYARNPAKAA